MKVSKIKGTLDYFGKEVEKYRYIEDKAKEIAKEFGYEEIITPMFEYTEVFTRSAGESSDIVNKEMYSFLDRGDRSLTLRPEATAGISRAYVENKMYVEPGLKKFYYYAQAFRAERPQAGRFRQFTQFGIEAIGPESTYLDADVIYLGAMFLHRLGIDNYKLVINTLGSEEGRKNYQIKLKDYFSKHIDCMCDDCKNRLITNPLRILDCKVDAKSDIMANAPKIIESLSLDDQNRFKEVLNTLDKLGIKYEVNPKLVRGLDYYNHTVFEFICDDEKSSLNGVAILAGGRYNGLSKAFDGPSSDAIGFGCGVERLMIILDELGLFEESKSKADVIVVNIGDDTKLEALRMVNYLRANHVKADLDYNSSSLKSEFKLCDRKLPKKIIIIGSTEIENNQFRIKDTETRTEEIKNIDELNEIFMLRGEKYAYQK